MLEMEARFLLIEAMVALDPVAHQSLRLKIEKLLETMERKHEQEKIIAAC
jgi:hypothetical protein